MKIKSNFPIRFDRDKKKVEIINKEPRRFVTVSPLHLITQNEKSCIWCPPMIKNTPLAHVLCHVKCVSMNFVSNNNKKEEGSPTITEEIK